MSTFIKDQRKNHRYALDDSITISNNDIFQLIDLSEGGIRFSCPGNTQMPEHWETDILTSKGALSNYGVELVWVAPTEDGNYNKLSKMAGAKFRNLTRVQRSALGKIIIAISRTRVSEPQYSFA